MQPQTTGSDLTPRQRVTLLASTVAGHGLKHVFNAAFFVILPEIKTGLGLSNTQVGGLTTVRNVAGGLANLPAGFLADRFSHRQAAVLGLTLASVGVFALLIGLATNYWWAVAAAALMTIAISFWHPSAISALSRHFYQRRGFAISLHGTGGSIGEATGPLIAGALLSVLLWRTVLQGSAVPALLLGLGVWLALRTVPARAEEGFQMRAYLTAVGRVLRNRRMIVVLLMAGGFSGGQSTILTFMPVYLREDVGLSTVTVGLYLFLAQAAGIGSQPVMGHLSDRLGRKAVLVPALLVLSACYSGLYLVPSGWPFVLVVVLMGAFLYSLMSLFLASAMDLVEESVRAMTVSFVFGAAIGVSGISPGIAGVFADAYGLKTTFLWASGVVMLAALLALLARWQADRA